MLTFNLTDHRSSALMKDIMASIQNETIKKLGENLQETVNAFYSVLSDFQHLKIDRDKYKVLYEDIVVQLQHKSCDKCMQLKDNYSAKDKVIKFIESPSRHSPLRFDKEDNTKGLKLKFNLGQSLTRKLSFSDKNTSPAKTTSTESSYTTAKSTASSKTKQTTSEDSNMFLEKDVIDDLLGNSEIIFENSKTSTKNDIKVSKNGRNKSGNGSIPEENTVNSTLTKEKGDILSVNNKITSGTSTVITANCQLETENNQETLENNKTVDSLADSSTPDITIDDLSLSGMDESMSGRSSPILKYNKNPKIKKESPDTSLSNCYSITTPQKKSLKLSMRGQPSKVPSGQNRKLTQTKLIPTIRKPSRVLDVSAVEGFCGGVRNKGQANKLEFQNESLRSSLEDDIIMPSPTSEVIKKELSSLSRSKLNETSISPLNFKAPHSKLKPVFKNQDDSKITFDVTNADLCKLDKDLTQVCKPGKMAETLGPESVNLLDGYRDKILTVKQELPSPTKRAPLTQKQATTDTECDVSMSILAQPHKPLSAQRDDIKYKTFKNENSFPSSPLKRRTTVEKPDFIYKEEPIRKKAEKRKLPGWVCDDCEAFIKAYKGKGPDSEEKIRQHLAKCSKHRSRFDPGDRARTPPGYYSPNWTVPEDTMELNFRNNAI